RVLREPTETWIGCGPAIDVLFKTRHGSIVDYSATLVTPRRVDDLAHRNLLQVAGDDPIDQARRVPSCDAILEERRDVDQCRGIANRVVFVVVMRFVGADRVVTRPLAIGQALAQSESSFMKWSANGHYLSAGFLSEPP